MSLRGDPTEVSRVHGAFPRGRFVIPVQWRRSRGRGFTLIELLLVVMIIGILVLLFLPILQSAREASRRTQCVNNLKHMGLAIQNYVSASGSFPPGYLYEPAFQGSRRQAAKAPAQIGWGVCILPFIEGTATYNMLNFELPLAHPAAGTVCMAQLNIFHCPEVGEHNPFPLRGSMGDVQVRQLPPSDYVAVAGQWNLEVFPGENNGLHYGNSQVRVADIGDGLGNTLAIGERSGVCRATWIGIVPGGWVCPLPDRANRECKTSEVMVLGRSRIWDNPLVIAVPNDPKAGVDNFVSLHPDGANFTFADGSVRLIRSTVNPQVFDACVTRCGGEIIASGSY